MKYLLIILAVLFILSPPIYSYAQTDASVIDAAVNATTQVQPIQSETSQEWWQLLLKHLIELAFFVLTTIASIFVGVLAKKYNFESYTDKLNDVLARASSYAEQKSIALAKLDGKKTPGAEKMDVAIQFAMNLSKEYKLPQKGSEWWSGKLESWLGVKKEK